MIHFSVSINLDDVSAFSIYFSLNMSIQDTTQKNMIYRYTLADETVEMRFGDFSEFCEILELSEFCTRHPDPRPLQNVQGWEQGASEFLEKSEGTLHFSEAHFFLRRSPVCK